MIWLKLSSHGAECPGKCGQAESDVSAGRWLCVAAQELLIRCWGGVVAVLTTTRHLFVCLGSRSFSWRRDGGCGVVWLAPHHKASRELVLHPSSSISSASFIACLVFSLDIAAVLARDPISCRNKLRRRGHGGRCVLLPGAGTPYVVQLRVRLRRFLLLGGGHVAAPV